MPLVPVLSLVIYRDEDRTQVLLGVRTATSTSGRHSDVLSTPTMRIPKSVMAAMLSEDDLHGFQFAAPTFKKLAPTELYPIGKAYTLDKVVAYAAEALMARKLGLSDDLVNGRLPGFAAKSALAYDEIYDDFGGYEQTFMLTLEVTLDAEPSKLGPTSSYSRLDWVPTSAIPPSVKARDPLLLLPDASVWEVCIHGLCVRSAAFAISENGRQP